MSETAITETLSRHVVWAPRSAPPSTSPRPFAGFACSRPPTGELWIFHGGLLVRAVQCSLACVAGRGQGAWPTNYTWPPATQLSHRRTLSVSGMAKLLDIAHPVWATRSWLQPIAAETQTVLRMHQGTTTKLTGKETTMQPRINHRMRIDNCAASSARQQQQRHPLRIQAVRTFWNAWFNACDHSLLQRKAAQEAVVTRKPLVIAHHKLRVA